MTWFICCGNVKEASKSDPNPQPKPAQQEEKPANKVINSPAVSRGIFFEGGTNVDQARITNNAENIQVIFNPNVSLVPK